jgi:hypothetical protein
VTEGREFPVFVDTNAAHLEVPPSTRSQRVEDPISRVQRGTAMSATLRA